MDFLSLVYYLRSKDVDFENIGSDVLDEFHRRDIKFKDVHEVNVFIQFIKYLAESKMFESNDFSSYTDDFLIGYEFAQLNKEFDLLRFGENFNINIELKRKGSEIKKLDQLNKNHFFLKFLDTPTYYFSYSFEDNILLAAYGESGEECISLLDVDSLEHLKNILKQQTYEYMSRKYVDELFDVSNYLVSPFNDTQNFMEKKYLLSPHQDEIKRTIIKSNNNAFLINAKPGTGKSLLMLDMAKTLMLDAPSEKILIIHGANLNLGHESLVREGFNILRIKDYREGLMQNPEYIFIDETQRIKASQFKNIVNKIKELNAKLVVLMDSDQTLRKTEDPKEIIKILEEEFENQFPKFELSEKYRNNKEMASFISIITQIPKKINPKKLIPNINKNIIVKYFANNEQAEKYFEYLYSKEYIVLGYTTDLINSDPFENTPLGTFNSHKIIGQEFDNVAILIDSNFKYVEEDNYYKLVGTEKSFYSSNEMFYQNITRARKRLAIVVIDNLDAFEKICSVLNVF